MGGSEERGERNAHRGLLAKRKLKPLAAAASRRRSFATSARRGLFFVEFCGVRFAAVASAIVTLLDYLLSWLPCTSTFTKNEQRSDPPPFGRGG